MGSKHVGANSFKSVTAYVILYSYIQVHKLVQIESMNINDSMIFVKSSIIEFNVNPVGGFRCRRGDGRADRQNDVNKLLSRMLAHVQIEIKFVF